MDKMTARFLLLALAMVLCMATMWAYFWGLGPERYSTIEATRPVLVFTLIIAMLGFGGLMIFKAFDTDVDKQNFAHAREIFLVFAGIFGTIIGFYFGAADDQESAPPSLSEPAYEAGRISVEIAGGAAPFISLLTIESRPDDSQVRQGDDRALSFAVGHCPTDASITVVDGEGNRDQAEITCPAEEPEATGADANAVANTTNAAEGNAL
jgi:hypothetical protein